MSRPFEPRTPTAPSWARGTDNNEHSYGGDTSYTDSYTGSYTDAPTERTSSYGAGSYGSYTPRSYESTYSTTTVADRPDHMTDHHQDGGHADDDYADYPDDGYYEYDEPIDRRWVWVAGVAGAILLVAVICTIVILGGGDSGPVSATVTPPAPTSSAPTAPYTMPSAAAPPRVAAVPSATLAPETVTTVTPPPPAPPTAAATPTDVVPPVPAPVAAPPAASGQTMTYQITGNKSLLDLVTVIYTDGQGALQTDVNVALPWSRTITLNPGVSLTSVTATSVTGQLNCVITDGSGAAIAAQNNNTIITSCTK